jgi:hypothetical protein
MKQGGAQALLASLVLSGLPGRDRIATAGPDRSSPSLQTKNGQ